ncbi:hypothetical protein B0T25DRAFT_578495 [Lasiosphaeria hispida]|uniref:Secreted protein n=1 Tax=Lasiosphaeria hispida TaxID=260671 RepID=A0AAJ0HSG4_9PEZI|nr:hypothetical protein B0T25DRAFT_578495 [Lasiosphaeria hispida]
MLKTLASAVAALALVLPAFAAPATSPAIPIELAKRDSCANYRFMAMGQLEFHNDAPIAAYVRWSYDGNNWSRLPKNGAIIQSIAIDEWWEFDRSTELSVIQRDRNFYLQVCEDIINNCSNVPGVFQIPGIGKQQWVADIRAEIGSTIFTWRTTCNVDRQAGDATTP